MIYEYKLTDDLLKEDIEDVLLTKGRIVIKNHNNFMLHFLLPLYIIPALIITKIMLIFDCNIIFIEFFVIGSIVLILSTIYWIFLRKDLAVKTAIDQIKKNLDKDMTIQILKGSYVYSLENKVAIFRKKNVLEIIKLEKYTLVIIANAFKHSSSHLIFIPDNLFESENEYNEFMNCIAK